MGGIAANEYLLEKSDAIRRSSLRTKRCLHAITQYGVQIFKVAHPGKVTIGSGVVLAPESDGTLSISDDASQLFELDEAAALEDGFDDIDFSFAVVPQGEGGHDHDDEEIDLIYLVIEDLSEHGFEIAESVELPGIFTAKNNTGINVLLFKHNQGVRFQIGFKIRNLSAREYGDLFGNLNSFNNESVLTKAFLLEADLPFVCFESWLPPAYSTEVFELFFSLFLRDVEMSSDDELRERLDSYLLR